MLAAASSALGIPPPAACRHVSRKLPPTPSPADSDAPRSAATRPQFALTSMIRPSRSRTATEVFSEPRIADFNASLACKAPTRSPSMARA